MTKEGAFVNSDQDQQVPRRGWLRAGLIILATPMIGTGCWALLLPRTFYEDFPRSGWGWVSTLGPYDEHLVRDYGAMNLALCFLLVAAAIFLERRLSRIALGTLLVIAVPHFFFHLTQTHQFSLLQNLAQLGGLGFQILLPLALLALTAARGATEDVSQAERNERVRWQARKKGATR
jgi:hypothetical protein